MAHSGFLSMHDWALVQFSALLKAGMVAAAPHNFIIWQVVAGRSEIQK